MSAAPTARLGRGQIVLLGALSALGPIGVDIYLPAFPAIAASLGTGLGPVQLSMSAYFLALSVGQPIYGRVSDRVGRKRPICFGIAVFVAGSVAAALATGIAGLIVARFVQGIGICAVLALMRAVVRDLHQGAEAAHLNARLLLIVSVSPLLAPLLGSTIVAGASWRLIFVLLAVLGAISLALCARWLPETRAPRSAAPAAAIGYATLLRQRAFRRPLWVLAAAQAGASIYLATASSIYLDVQRLSLWQYSLAFALNAVGMIGLAQCNRGLILRFGLPAVVRLGTGLGCAAMLLLVAASSSGLAPLTLLLASYFLYFAAFGFVMGPASVLALEAYPHAAGTAAALLGTLQFAAGAAAALLAGLAYERGVLPVFVLQLATALLAAAAAITLRAPGEAPLHLPATAGRKPG